MIDILGKFRFTQGGLVVDIIGALFISVDALKPNIKNNVKLFLSNFLRSCSMTENAIREHFVISVASLFSSYFVDQFGFKVFFYVVFAMFFLFTVLGMIVNLTRFVEYFYSDSHQAFGLLLIILGFVLQLAGGLL